MTINNEPQIILGIDPGLRKTGIALIELSNYNSINKTCKLKESFTIKNKFNITFDKCLVNIFQNITQILTLKSIHSIAIERTIYVQNFKTANILAAVKGVIITAAAIKDIKYFEYSPTNIKQVIVGNGRASKEQVSQKIFNFLQQNNTFKLNFDESDAVATALCHILSSILSE